MIETKRERYIRLLKSKADLDFVELSFDAIKEIIELLEEPLPNSSESPNGWIPCTKEHPNPWELVWTTDKHGNVAVCQLSHKDSDWYDADEEWFYNRDSIIAWMPYEVPEPYQPKEDES